MWAGITTTSLTEQRPPPEHDLPARWRLPPADQVAARECTVAGFQVPAAALEEEAAFPAQRDGEQLGAGHLRLPRHLLQVLGRRRAAQGRVGCRRLDDQVLVQEFAQTAGAA